ncbi:MAG: hypothetical protein RKE49_01645 [Oceanicaulis sp.]
MLVSHPYKFIFLKPGKTAGTSVEVFLEPLCAAPGHTPSHATPPIESEYGVIGERGPDPDKSGFYNHIWPDELVERLPAEVWRDYVKTATVRNPFDRAVSAFHHFGLTDADRDAPQSQIPGLFRRWAMERSPAYFTIKRYLAIGDAPCLDHFIRYEDLEGTISAFLEKVGAADARLGALPRLKTDIRKVDIPLVEYYDAAVRDRVIEGARFDFDHLGYSTSVEDADRARAGVAAAAKG